MAFIEFVDYTKIDRPYSSFLERTDNTTVDTQNSGSSAVPENVSLGGSFSGGLVTGQNGSVEVQPVKSDGGLSDLWIKNFIRSENWRPKKMGFYIDGQSGYAEFSNVYVSGNIQALTGNVGGWIIGTNLLKSAQTGARIELNKGLNRISIFDSLNEVVVMGYLEGLVKNDGTGTWGASNYGFWARSGDKLSIDGDGEYVSGDWVIQNDANYLIKDVSDNIIIRLGTDTGEKGLFIYNTSAVQLAKFISDEIFVGNTTESLKYTVAGGLEISDPVISDNMVCGETIAAGDAVAVVAGGKILKTNYYVDGGRNYGLALSAGVLNDTIKVQKTGPYTTSGKLAGYYYQPSTTYGSEVITIDQTTRDSVYDANLGVGQVFKGSMLFTSAISLYLSTPGGAGTYGYKINIYALTVAEGGLSAVPASDTITITRAGSTATAVTAGTYCWETGEYAIISGADQAEYNGVHRVTLGSCSTGFQFEVSGAPATPATGTIAVVNRAIQWGLAAGSITSTGTGEAFLKFDLLNSSVYPNLNDIYGSAGSVFSNFYENGSIIDAKYLIEFWADTAGEIDIAYNSSSVYADGDLWLSGVPDTGKDLAFRLRERNGAGTLSAAYDATTRTMGLARSTTKLMLGRFS